MGDIEYLRLLDYGLEWLELVCIIYYINENCIFKEFVDFEDCCFDGDVVLENVKFVKGTNLLGNKDTPVEVSFEKNLVLVNIEGDIAMNTYGSSG